MSAKPISHLKGRTQNEGVQEQGAEENIWISRERE
jgi:hypothetical protein